MIQIIEKAACTGCGACSLVCPVECIRMKRDEEGFAYPQADPSLCVDCGMCEAACPVCTPKKNRDINENGYIVRQKDFDLLKSSSSGGAFMAICDYTLEHGGIVFGAACDRDWNVIHTPAETKEECRKFMGSKYVQTCPEGMYLQARRNLEAGRWVCFSGTPCQIAGLDSYLGKKYERLILVDFVCHGVPSPLLWDSYLEKKDRGHIQTVNFRSKKYGYQMSGMEIRCSDRKKPYFATARTDEFLKTFFSGRALRWSCYQCPFKGTESAADFTLFDSWYYGKLPGIRDDDLGYTNVLVRGERAEQILMKLSDRLEIHELPVSMILPANGGMLMHSAAVGGGRQEFYSRTADCGLHAAVQDYHPVRIYDRIIERIKLTGAKTGISQKVSRWKKKIKHRK